MSFSVAPQTTRRLVDSLQYQFRLYGYEIIETPIIESADLFLTRAGDQLINRLFTFERSGQQLALRPEFTAAAAHRYAQMDKPATVRWQYSGPIFEDSPGSRSYQRMSMGAELIGMDGPAADAEVISLAVQGIVKQGLQNWELLIGHIGLIRHLLGLFGLDRRTERFLLNHLDALQDPSSGKDYIMEVFDHTLLSASSPLEQAVMAENDEHTQDLTEISTHQMLNVLLDATQRGMTMGGRTQHDIARRLLQKRQRFTERHQVVAALDLLEQWVAISKSAETAFDTMEKLLPANDATGYSLLANWHEAVNLLTSCGILLNQVIIQPHVARHWDYYTGMVFEISTGQGVQLAGGGRYDELVSLVGNRSVPAVGFAYYLDHMLDCLPQEQQNTHEMLYIAVNPDNQQAVSQLAYALRSRDLAVVLTNTPDSDSHIIQVGIDGRITFNGESYSSADLDTLIEAITAGNV